MNSVLRGTPTRTEQNFSSTSPFVHSGKPTLRPTLKLKHWIWAETDVHSTEQGRTTAKIAGAIHVPFPNGIRSNIGSTRSLR